MREEKENLEDDFAFKPSSLKILSQLEQKLGAAEIKDWDVINLGNIARKIYRTLPKTTFSQENTHLCRALYFPVTTTGLIWSKVGAHRFLRQAHHIYEPVDATLQRLMCASGRGLAFREGVLQANGSESVISEMGSQEAAMKNANILLRAKRYTKATSRLFRGPYIG